MLQENHRAINLTDSAQLRMLLLPTMLDCPPVQSFHNSTVNFRVHAVSPFSSTVTKGHFSRNAFLNIWKRLLFTGESFAGVWSIDSAMPSFEHETFLQMVPWFWWSIQLAASWMQRFLRETFFCFVSFVHAQGTSKSKSAYLCLLCMCTMSKSGFGMFRHKSFSYSLEKSERLCLLFFHEWKNPELLRGYP